MLKASGLSIYFLLQSTSLQTALKMFKEIHKFSWWFTKVKRPISWGFFFVMRDIYNSRTPLGSGGIWGLLYWCSSVEVLLLLSFWCSPHAAAGQWMTACLELSCLPCLPALTCNTRFHLFCCPSQLWLHFTEFKIPKDCWFTSYDLRYTERKYDSLTALGQRYFLN